MDPSNINSIARQIVSKWDQEQAIEDFKVYTAAFFGKLITSIKLTFECAISKQKINTAVFKYNSQVYLSGCIKQGSLAHFEFAFDLEQLLIHLYETDERLLMDDDNLKEIQCPHCQAYTDFSSLEQAILPHQFIQELRDRCGVFPKDIHYFHKLQRIIPDYQNQNLREYATKNQGKIMEILSVPTDESKQFRRIAIIKEEYNELMFYNICFEGQVRINIPVRGSQCDHYEAYDLVYLLKHMERNNGTYKCNCKHLKRVDYYSMETVTSILNSKAEKYQMVEVECKSVLNINDPKSFKIDYDLLNAGLLGFSFLLSFYYNPAFRILQDWLSYYQEDQILNSYKPIKDKVEQAKYLNSVYAIAEQVFLNEENQSQTKQYYEKVKLGQEALELSRCPITKCSIEIPCRCIHCPQLQVVDLRYMSCIIMKALEGSKECCPLCGHSFDKPTPKLKVLQLRKQIYVDVTMLKFVVLSNQFCRNINEFLKFMGVQRVNPILENTNSPTKPPAQAKIKIKAIYHDWTQLETIDFAYTKQCAMFTMKLKCILTDMQITKPVRTRACKHYDAFELEGIKKLLEMNQLKLETAVCPFPNCNQPLKSVENLAIDKGVLEMLPKVYARGNPKAVVFMLNEQQFIPK